MSIENTFKSYVDEGKRFKTREEALQYFKEIKDSIDLDVEYYFSWIEENLDEAISNFSLNVKEIEDEEKEEEIRNLHEELLYLAKTNFNDDYRTKRFTQVYKMYSHLMSFNEMKELFDKLKTSIPDEYGVISIFKANNHYYELYEDGKSERMSKGIELQ